MGSLLVGAYEDFDAWERWMELQRDSELVDWEEMDFAARAGLYSLFCSWAAKDIVQGKVGGPEAGDE